MKLELNSVARASQSTFLLRRRTLDCPEGQDAGSCFVYRHKGILYVVTARHVLEDGTDGLTIEGREHLPLTEVARHNKYDVAILKPPEALDAPQHLLQQGQPIVYAEDLYSFGFPSLAGGRLFNRHRDRDYLMPLCRKGIMSGGGSDGMYIDGHVNPGMSGGPVVTESGVVGVIAGWYTQELPNDRSVELAMKNNIALELWENAGLYAAVHFHVVIELMEAAQTAPT